MYLIVLQAFKMLAKLLSRFSFHYQAILELVSNIVHPTIVSVSRPFQKVVGYMWLGKPRKGRFSNYKKSNIQGDFGHNWVKILVSSSPIGYMLWYLGFILYQIEVYSIDSPTMIGDVPKVFSFNQNFV